MIQDATTFPGVRIAKESDEVGLFALLTLMHAESGMAPMAPERVLERLRLGTRGQGGIIGVIDGPQGIEASIGIFFSTWWYSSGGATHLEESWCFVAPEYRRSTHAKLLLQFAKWVKNRIGLPLLVGVLTKERLAPKLRLYQRELRQVGALFLDGGSDADYFDQRRIAETCSKHDVEKSAAANRPHRPRAPEPCAKAAPVAAVRAR